MSAWVIARCFTFPATTKVLRQGSAWAEICLADLWTTEFGGYNTDFGRPVYCDSPANAGVQLDQELPPRVKMTNRTPRVKPAVGLRMKATFKRGASARGSEA